jgi:hypothetical protein
MLLLYSQKLLDDEQWHLSSVSFVCVAGRNDGYGRTQRIKKNLEKRALKHWTIAASAGWYLVPARNHLRE